MKAGMCSVKEAQFSWLSIRCWIYSSPLKRRGLMDLPDSLPISFKDSQVCQGAQYQSATVFPAFGEGDASAIVAK